MKPQKAVVKQPGKQFAYPPWEEKYIYFPLIKLPMGW